MPDKIEGVTLIDCTHLAVANDNDFDIGTFDQNGMNVGTGAKSRILVITLDVSITPNCGATPSPTPSATPRSTAQPSPPSTGNGGYLPGLPNTGAGGGPGGSTAAFGLALLVTLLGLALLMRATRRRA